MEIEITEKEEEEKIAHRLAVLNKCLSANEIVESRPIRTLVRQIIDSEPNSDGNNNNRDVRGAFEAEIFLTNVRILLILYMQYGNQYDEKSIFYSSTADLQIKSNPKYPDISHINQKIKGSSTQVNYFTDKLSNQDVKLIQEVFKKKKQLGEGNNSNNQNPGLPNTAVSNESSSRTQHLEDEQIKKRILEREAKLKSLFELVVEKKKILTEDQFWQNHEGYQNFLKFRNRDEEKIRRDYIQNEIPLVGAKITADISAEALDEKQTRFNEFREEIYDSENIIENQNLKSFQSYKQDIFFAGKIDALVQKIQKQTNGNMKANSADFESDQHGHHLISGHNTHHLEIEEVNLFTGDRHAPANPVEKELSREEYIIRMQQNPSPDSQKKLTDFIAKAKEASAATTAGGVATQGPSAYKSSLAATAEQFQLFKKVSTKEEKKLTQDSFTGAFNRIYKFQISNEDPKADPALARKQAEEYADKFYQLREILRWLYKEKNSADKARPEIIEKLKTELEQIRNSLQDSSSQQGIQNQPTADTKQTKGTIHDQRLADLKRSFLYQ